MRISTEKQREEVKRVVWEKLSKAGDVRIHHIERVWVDVDLVKVRYWTWHQEKVMKSGHKYGIVGGRHVCNEAWFDLATIKARKEVVFGSSVIGLRKG